MTGDLDLDALTRLAEAATPGPSTRDSGWSATAEPPEDWEGPYVVLETRQRNDAEYLAAVDPATVVALVERLRAAESAVERVDVLRDRWRRQADGAASGLVFYGAQVAAMLSDALDGPGAPASTQADPESTDDPNGPQNAANEGDA